MGRTTVLLVLCAWSAACLPACGQGLVGAPDDTPTFLEAAPPTLGNAPEQPRTGPTLRGRAPAPAARARAGAAMDGSGPLPSVDSRARISIPPRATWGAVKTALAASARLRRERENLAGDAAVLVPLPGLKGYVVVGTPPRSPLYGASPLSAEPRLSLTLSGSVDSPSTGIDARGTAWITEGGCTAQMRWEADAWSLSPWQAALQGLEQLNTIPEHAIHVRADDAVPAARVLPFLSAAAAAGFDAPHVSVATGRRRKYDDAVDDALRWLAAHQLPNGGWDDDLALGWCDGLRMRGVDVPAYQAEDPGLTGLALCAFLGAGYTNRGKHPFARVVSRGLRHLKNVQQPTGRFGSDAWAHRHGWAALAMVEAYGMTGSLLFKGPAQRALDALSAAWRSSGDDPHASLLSTMALRSAQLINADAKKRGNQAPLTTDAKLENELREEAILLASERGPLRSAAGLMSRILLGDDPRKHIDLSAGAQRLVDSVLKCGKEADPTLTWVSTLIAFQVGGKQVWGRMKEGLEKFTINTEIRNGHACCLKGSWDPRAASEVTGGRVATTALFSMSLQVFYRYSRVFGTR